MINFLLNYRFSEILGGWTINTTMISLTHKKNRRFYATLECMKTIPSLLQPVQISKTLFVPVLPVLIQHPESYTNRKQFEQIVIAFFPMIFHQFRMRPRHMVWENFYLLTVLKKTVVDTTNAVFVIITVTETLIAHVQRPDFFFIPRTWYNFQNIIVLFELFTRSKAYGRGLVSLALRYNFLYCCCKSDRVRKKKKIIDTSTNTRSINCTFRTSVPNMYLITIMRIICTGVGARTTT